MYFLTQRDRQSVPRRQKPMGLKDVSTPLRAYATLWEVGRSQEPSCGTSQLPLGSIIRRQLPGEHIHL